VEVNSQSRSGRFVTGKMPRYPLNGGGVVSVARFEEEQSFLPPPDIETQFLGLPPRS